MRTALVLFLCLTSGCAAARPIPTYGDPELGCQTACGLRAPLETDCKAFQRAQDVVLAAYTVNVPRWSVKHMCAALKGWQVLVALDAGWDGVFEIPWEGAEAGKNGRLRVLGATFQGMKLVELGTNAWEHSALAHELGHVFRKALDRADEDVWDTGLQHRSWTPLGLCAAINAASLLRDDCEDEDYMAPVSKKPALPHRG